MQLEDIAQIVLKFVAAGLVGSIIGIERERSHRAAGFRTHFLVALGAATVMIIGEQLTARYGVNVTDPSRLAAQVISGIGFLGAGTILKDGVNVRGLTTAASLWATACIGIAAGAGMYLVALIGTIGAVLALTVLETVESRFVKTKHSRAVLDVLCCDSSPEMHSRVYSAIHQHGLEIVGISISALDQGCKMELRIGSPQSKGRDAFADLCTQLSQVEGVTNVKSIAL